MTVVPRWGRLGDSVCQSLEKSGFHLGAVDYPNFRLLGLEARYVVRL